MNEELGETRMYTQEELDEVKEDSQDQKMNFIIDMLNDNTKEIERIRDTLHNGWDRQIWYNTLFRKGGLWFLAAIIVVGLGYAITLI